MRYTILGKSGLDVSGLLSAPGSSVDWALKDLDLVASAAGACVAPIAVAIADRWRDLVSDGSSGLDVSAARRGLGGDIPARTSDRSPDPRNAASR